MSIGSLLKQEQGSDYNYGNQSAGLESISQSELELDISQIKAEADYHTGLFDDAQKMIGVADKHMVALESLGDTPSELKKQSSRIEMHHEVLFDLIAESRLKYVGIESITAADVKDSPVYAVKAGVEGFGSFKDNMIKAVKLTYLKIVNAIKKLAIKALVMMNGTHSSAVSLEKEIKKIKQTKPSRSKFEDSETDKINKWFPSIAENEITVDKIKTKLTDYASNTMDKYDTVQTAIALMTEAVVKPQDKDTPQDILENFLGALALSGAGKGQKTTLDINFTDGEYDFPIVYNGANVSGVTLTMDEELIKYENGGFVVTSADKKGDNKDQYNDENDGAYSDVIKSVRFIKFKQRLDDSGFHDGELPVGSKADLVALVGELKKTSKGITKFKDKVLKSITKSEKALSKVNKSDKFGKSTWNAFKGTLANTSQTLATSCMLDMVLGYLQINKATLAYCKLTYDMYDGADEL